MPFTDEQLDLMATHLRISPLDDQRREPTTTLTVTKRQLLLIIQALNHFRETACTQEGGPPGCAMIGWYEQPGTGAMVRTCVQSCDTWIAELIRDVLPQAFPAVEGPKLRLRYSAAAHRSA